MAVKHQSDCYRTFGGLRWVNFCDMFEDEHFIAVANLKASGARVKIRTHPEGYQQAFVHPDDIAKRDQA